MTKLIIFGGTKGKSGDTGFTPNPSGSYYFLMEDVIRSHDEKRRHHLN